ncbi:MULTISPECIES: DegV family protein [Gemella]|uniref:DegV family protein n=1 Tax=Gemella TaxID=1378 RepID=UPI000767E997|nr:MULTISPECIES: DegV family protein [Gemella]AME09374.1 EDD domain protein [Gemella sp. oral taxon 928]AXI27010.1 DegV family protein [Gemella sp. ND 6198]
MEKVKIVIDSTSDLTFDEIDKYDVEVVPLTMTIDGVDYNYKTIANDEYIVKMRTANEFSTSQPALGSFLKVFEKWTKEGYKLLVLTISSALSGTYNTALSAGAEFKDIYVVDTKTTTRGMVYLLEEAIKELSENIPLEKVVVKLREKAKNILTFVTIDSLDNLVKGGRLSKSAALIGGLLNIKVLTQLRETELVAVDKVRGKKKLVHALIKKIIDEKGERSIKRISLPNALADEYVELIKKEVKDELDYVVKDEDIMTTTPAISTHTGEKAVGIIVELV